MSDNEQSKESSTRSISPVNVVAIVGITAILAPLGIIFYSFPSSFSMAGMVWTYSNGFGYFGGSSYFIVDPFMLIASLPFTFLRFVFIWMMYRLYRSKTTFKRAVVAGIAAELQLPVFYLIISLPMLLYYPEGIFYMQFPIPIPVLILVAFLLTKRYPIPEDKQWIEREQVQQWWEKPEEAPNITPEPVESIIPEPVESQSSEEDDWLKE
ncbi:MAG: hypothetical protein ACFFF4_01005 [Candidatus Thorarchaeota archaeon]